MSDKDLKVKISVEGDTSGAKAVEASLKDVKAAAQDTEDELSKLLREQAEWSAKMRGQLDGVDGGAKPPPLPGGGPSTGDIAAGAGIGALGATAAIEAMGLVVKAGAALAQALGNGAAEAVNLAQELNSLPADKAAELRAELGPLADIIDANSVTLLELGEASKQANQQLENFWTMAGVRLAPALRDMAQAAAGVDLSPIANGIGDTFGGAMVLVNRTGEAFGKVNASVQEFIPGMDLGTAALQATNSALSGVIPGYGALALAVSGLTAVNQEALAAEQARQAVLAADEKWAREQTAQAERAKAIAEAGAQAREALLSTEERIAAIKERQAALLAQTQPDAAAIKEAAANEQLLITLDAKLAKEQEAAAITEETTQKNREAYELQVALAEAVAAGNGPEQERLQYAIDYAAAIRSAGEGNEDLARRQADAQAAQRATAATKAAAAEKKKEDAERMAALRDQAALERAKSQTRLAELKASGADQKAMDAERIAEAEKLRVIELEIAKLRGDAAQTEALQAEARKQEALALQASQQTAAATPGSPSPQTPGGELINGTNRRRGSITSDVFETGIDAGTSLLDQYTANKDKAVGERGGKSPLGADPKSSIGESAKDIKATSEAITAEMEAIAESAKQFAAAAKSLDGKALAKLRADLDALTAKVNSIAKQT
jgi:hypothetical protein